MCRDRPSQRGRDWSISSRGIQSLPVWNKVALPHDFVATVILSKRWNLV
jgi:hypothetical protein